MYFLMDESGSMATNSRETVSGYNKFVEELKKDYGDYVLASFFRFEGLQGVRKIYERVPAQYIHIMDHAEFRPGGDTPLFDAIGRAVASADIYAKEGEAVVIVILTDGQENSSTEYRQKEQIKDLINARKAKGWKFVFLGADIDAFTAGNGLGINRGDIMGFRGANSSASLAQTASGLSQYRSVYANMADGTPTMDMFTPED